MPETRFGAGFRLDINDEDISLLMSILERPLTVLEISFITNLKLAVCCARVRKLMSSGLLYRFALRLLRDSIEEACTSISN